VVQTNFCSRSLNLTSSAQPSAFRFVAAMQARQQKITLAEMRASGVRSLLIYCADYHCSHAIEIVSALCTLCNSSAVR
jgi:hypothetical protein